MFNIAKEIVSKTGTLLSSPGKQMNSLTKIAENSQAFFPDFIWEFWFNGEIADLAQ
jgi:hypothetical protein